jgi:transcriptional regulator with XRE-family HTH domain
LSQDFDLDALYTALNDRREALGISWADVGAALGVTAGTLRGYGARRRAEGDGVLRAVAWLGRSPESFVPGQRAVSVEMLLPGAARTLRFDARGLFAALEAERIARGLTWRDVAAECEVASVSALTRLRAGGRVMFPDVMRMLLWIGAPAFRFVRASSSRNA